MYTRRAYLAGSAVVFGASLSGCLRDAGAEAYESALEPLEANEQQLKPYLDSGEVPDGFDGERVRERADEADRHLDEAADHWGEEDQPKIEAARTVVDLHRAVADAGESQVAYQNCVEPALRNWHHQQFEEARDGIAGCGADLDRFVMAIGAIESHGSADAAPLEEVDSPLVFHSSDQYPFDTDSVTAIEAFQDGLEQFLVGAVDGNAGRVAWHQSEWETALDHLEPAVEKFEQADQSLGGIESGPALPPKVEHWLAEFSCYADNHLEATELFVESAEAAQNEDFDTAESKGEEAQDVLEPC